MMGEFQAQVPDEHPMKQAWDKYKASSAYENARKWALHNEADAREYVDGSLWAAFCQGWEKALTERPTTASVEESSIGGNELSSKEMAAHLMVRSVIGKVAIT